MALRTLARDIACLIRRDGVRATAHKIETALSELGYARVWGYVRGDNRPARWLYSTRGYEVVGHAHPRIR